MELTEKQEKWLNRCVNGYTWWRDIPGHFEINQETGLVDIYGTFDCSNQGIEDFMGIRFGVVTGIKFDCSYNELTSLEGAPLEIGSEDSMADGAGFLCSHNNLKKLGNVLPKQKNYLRYFDCKDNLLENLVGLPKNIMNLDFSKNRIISLKGIPLGFRFTEESYLKHFYNESYRPDVVHELDYIRCEGNVIPERRIRSIYKTMVEFNCDYWMALALHAKGIKYWSPDIWEKILKDPEVKHFSDLTDGFDSVAISEMYMTSLALSELEIN